MSEEITTQLQGLDPRPERTRTHSWSDPGALADGAKTRSGLEFLQALASGELAGAPVFTTLGMETAFLEIAKGRVVMQFVPREYHYNVIGSVHGGVITTILDTVVACAVHSTLPAGTGYTTLEIKVNFTRAVRVNSGVLRCEGNVITVGRTIGTAEGRLLDSQGRVCAYATTTCLIFPHAP